MKIRLTTLALLTPLLVSCANVPDAQNVPVDILTAPPADNQLTTVMPVQQALRPQDVLDVIFHMNLSSATAYRIQPMDKVEVLFANAPELNGTRLVMPDGVVELPYVNGVKIGGLTVDEARAQLTRSYLKVLRRPEITLSVPQLMSKEENLRLTLNHPSYGQSREILVGDDGTASFPLLGNLSVRGMTISQLEAELDRRYANQTGHMKVDVLLKSTAPNEVYILGEVAQPGAYPVRRPISVLEALTLARGATVGAKLDSAVIMQRQGDHVVARVYDLSKLLDGKAAAFAYLRPDDLLYIPKTRLSRAGQFSKQLADVLLFQGVGVGLSYRLDNKGDTVYREQGGTTSNTTTTRAP
ncbi:polysaccharide biosynthesis/export family protein [Pseudomonas oryzihabitans]|uniref:polysaccharide biosynthesis/export family protein n=1 Tax=Pseudomonas oryzihabitans TaxID=47885 RepID=UPI0011247906|nr:polysaccharide biosynthesis/export family protein [Pseudomonas psychrotolerans]QDD88711.1 polysaccharide biosynthesis protein [Pseudomonas psychrotolerans]